MGHLPSAAEARSGRRFYLHGCPRLDHLANVAAADADEPSPARNASDPRRPTIKADRSVKVNPELLKGFFGEDFEWSVCSSPYRCDDLQQFTSSVHERSECEANHFMARFLVT
ncbi:hypothetical protein TKK_0001665 [Trichogramma kaykai]